MAFASHEESLSSMLGHDSFSCGSVAPESTCSMYGYRLVRSVDGNLDSKSIIGHHCTGKRLIAPKQRNKSSWS